MRDGRRLSSLVLTMNTIAADAPNVRQAVPFFGVTDIDASLRFYVDGLGFR